MKALSSVLPEKGGKPTQPTAKALQADNWTGPGLALLLMPMVSAALQPGVAIWHSVGSAGENIQPPAEPSAALRCGHHQTVTDALFEMNCFAFNDVFFFFFPNLIGCSSSVLYLFPFVSCCAKKIQ